jgi:hypothetical protein
LSAEIKDEKKIIFFLLVSIIRTNMCLAECFNVEKSRKTFKCFLDKNNFSKSNFVDSDIFWVDCLILFFSNDLENRDYLVDFITPNMWY